VNKIVSIAPSFLDAVRGWVWCTPDRLEQRIKEAEPLAVTDDQKAVIAAMKKCLARERAEEAARG